MTIKADFVKRILAGSALRRFSSRSLPMLAGLGVAGVLFYALSLATMERGGPLPPRNERGNFPDFTLPALDGSQWKLSAQKGSVVLVNFWSSDCSPCLREIPALVTISRQFAGRDFKTAGVALDQYPSRRVPDIVDRFGIPYPILTCYPLGANPDGRPRPECGFRRSIEAAPTTILLDRDGHVARTFYGIVSERLLCADIEHLLAE